MGFGDINAFFFGGGGHAATIFVLSLRAFHMESSEILE